MLVGFLFLTGCEDQAVRHDAILGKWRSNAELTLDSIDDVQDISPQSRAIFADDFFGYLVIEIKEDESRTINEKDGYDSGFEPYEVLEVSDEYIRIKAWSNFFKDYDERILYLDGDCYYVIFAVFGFREYFCRHEG